MQTQGFQEELTTLQETAQADFDRVEAEEAARARQLEAQRTGHALRRSENIQLSRGRSAGEIAELTAGGIEGAQRSLAGLLKDINLQAQRTSANFAQQSIGTALTAEGLAGERSRLGTARSQFQQSLEETRRQFGLGQSLTREQMAQQQGQFMSGLGFSQAELAQQGSQFAAGLGFDQSQLAQQQRQFTADLKQQRREETKWWEPLLDFGGKAVGAYAGYKAYTFGGGGTCFDGSTLVSTPDGLIAISLMKDGDGIRTPGGFRSVVAVHEHPAF